MSSGTSFIFPYVTTCMVKIDVCFIKDQEGFWSKANLPDFHSPEDDGSELQFLQDYLSAYTPPAGVVAIRVTTEDQIGYIRIHPTWGMVPKFVGDEVVWPTNEEVGGVWEVPHVLPDGHIVPLLYVEPCEKFQMGDDESPASDRRVVKVEAQFLAKTPTTVEQWNWYAVATKKPPKATTNQDGVSILDHPVTEVNFWDSLEWAKWAGLGIPKEEEWERAARGNDGRKYPWGNEPPTTELCHFSTPEQEQTGTASVFDHPKGMGPYGHLDLSGNTWEWCDSPWKRE